MAIAETKRTKAQLRKLSAPRKSVGDDLAEEVFIKRCCMDRGGDGIRPFPSGSVRRYVRTQAVRVRSLCSGLSGRPGSP